MSDLRCIKTGTRHDLSIDVYSDCTLIHMNLVYLNKRLQFLKNLWLNFDERHTVKSICLVRVLCSDFVFLHWGDGKSRIATDDSSAKFFFCFPCLGRYTW